MRRTPFKFEWFECRGDLPTIEHKITVSLDEADEFIGMRGVNHRDPVNKLSSKEICKKMNFCRKTNIKYKEMTGYERYIVYLHLCDKWSYESAELRHEMYLKRKQFRPRRTAQPMRN